MGTLRLVVNPYNRVIYVNSGSNLLDALLSEGVEIPLLCNKNGSCGKCRVIVKAKANPVTELERISLGRSSIKEGYRLACRTEMLSDGEIFIPYESREDLLESLYQGDEIETLREKKFPYHITNLSDPSSGRLEYSVAMDLGTTTLTGYMFDNLGNLVSHCSLFNPTTLYGGDVITRMTYLQDTEKGLQKLRRSLFAGIRRLIVTMCARNRSSLDINKCDLVPENIKRIAVCGNTIMQHIFLGVDPSKIGLFPYKPIIKGLVRIRGEDFEGFKDMEIGRDTEIIVAPAVSGFIGGDTVCGILSTGLQRASEPELFIDLGTNGEMVLNSKGRLFAVSASAGPAFEGYRIRSGMRATIGSIDSVTIDERYNIRYSVIGGVAPRGICGTGTVTAIATLLRNGVLSETGHILPSRETGRIRKNAFIIADEYETSTGNPVMLTDRDVEVVQHAKAAFATGISYLLRASGLTPPEVERVYVAGAFGSRVDIDSLKDIGLIPYEITARITSVGNAAGAGVAMLLLSEEAEKEAVEIMNQIETVDIAGSEGFEEEFLNALFFRTGMLC